MKRNQLLFLSLISSLLVILTSFFQWDLVDLITEFLMLPIWLGVYASFIFVTGWTLVHLFKYKYWQPLIIQLITILIWFFFPFNQVNLDMNFKVHLDKREEVATKVENGIIKPNVSDNPSLIHLSKEYNRLSKGGGGHYARRERKGKINPVLYISWDARQLFGICI